MLTDHSIQLVLTFGPTFFAVPQSFVKVSQSEYHISYDPNPPGSPYLTKYNLLPSGDKEGESSLSPVFIFEFKRMAGPQSFVTVSQYETKISSSKALVDVK